VFSFLVPRRSPLTFVIPSVISERLGEIGLDVHRFCIRTLRFFPDVSARGRAASPPGLLLRRPVEARVGHPGRSDVPVDEARDGAGTRRPASGARRSDARECRTSRSSVPPEKLPLALRGVGVSRLRYVCLLWRFARV
jgi:hypothetical protein